MSSRRSAASSISMPFSSVSANRSSSCFSTAATRALRFDQFRIGLAHRFRQILHQPIEERLVLPQLVAVADGAADDAAQHVAAPFIAGNHAVDDEEGAGADVVGDHPQRIAG